MRLWELYRSVCPVPQAVRAAQGGPPAPLGAAATGGRRLPQGAQGAGAEVPGLAALRRRQPQSRCRRTVGRLLGHSWTLD